MLLTDSSNIYLGNYGVDSIYFGAYKVWDRVKPNLFVRGDIAQGSYMSSVPNPFYIQERTIMNGESGFSSMSISFPNATTKFKPSTVYTIMFNLEIGSITDNKAKVTMDWNEFGTMQKYKIDGADRTDFPYGSSYLPYERVVPVYLEFKTPAKISSYMTIQFYVTGYKRLYTDSWVLNEGVGGSVSTPTSINLQSSAEFINTTAVAQAYGPAIFKSYTDGMVIDSTAPAGEKPFIGAVLNAISWDKNKTYTLSYNVPGNYYADLTTLQAMIGFTDKSGQSLGYATAVEGTPNRYYHTFKPDKTMEGSVNIICMMRQNVASFRLAEVKVCEGTDTRYTKYGT